METVLIYVGLGIGAGLLAGMLGVGGGQVVVPGLLYIFHLKGFHNGYLVHMALGTSLATIVVTSLSSAYSHYRLGSINLNLVKRMTPGIVIGAALGGLAAGYFPSGALRMMFGVFLILLAVQMAFSLKPKPERELPPAASLTAISGVIGWVSAVVGVGGGSMVVPYLSWCNVNMKTAVGTASACGVPLALAGMAGYVISGWSYRELPSYSLGFIYVPAWLAVSLLSIVFTRVGASLTHRLPVASLKKLFSGFLFIAGIRILI